MESRKQKSASEAAPPPLVEFKVDFSVLVNTIQALQASVKENAAELLQLRTTVFELKSDKTNLETALARSNEKLEQFTV